MTVGALVLAGTRRGAEDPMAKAAGVSHKAILPVAGVPMVMRVLDALCRCPEIGEIAVSIERPEVIEALTEFQALNARRPIRLLVSEDSPSRSAAAGLQALGAPLVLTTADHALLQPDWVSAFLAAAPAGADVVAAVARAETVKAAAPDTVRTYLRFADAAVSGCNLFLLATPKAEGVLGLWKTVEAYRKKPIRLAWLLGPGALLKLALGRLTLGEAAARLGRLAGCEAAVVELPYGRAAIDVDKPADLDLVERLLGSR